jgi:predicted esterase
VSSDSEYEERDVDIIEVLETSGAEYDKVLVFLHGLGDGNEVAAERLTEHGFFGDSIEGTKVLFPNGYDTRVPILGWPVNFAWHNFWYWPASGEKFFALNDYFRQPSDCEVGWMKECTFDLNSMYIMGRSIAAIIEYEIEENGVDPENVFLAGYSNGGQMLFHVAFGQLEYTLGGYFAINTTP